MGKNRNRFQIKLSHKSDQNGNSEYDYEFLQTPENGPLVTDDMYAEIDLEIINFQDPYKLYFKIMGRNFDKDKLVKIFFEKEYTFTNTITRCISEDLTYFSDGGYPRVIIKNITMSDELYEDIMNQETEDTV